MERKTLGIILIVILVLFCACPGLCISIWGILMAVGGNMAEMGVEGFTATGNPSGFGIGGIVIGLVMVIGSVVGIIFAAKMGKDEEKEDIGEVPPAI